MNNKLLEKGAMLSRYLDCSDDIELNNLIKLAFIGCANYYDSDYLITIFDVIDNTSFTLVDNIEEDKKGVTAATLDVKIPLSLNSKMEELNVNYNVNIVKDYSLYEKLEIIIHEINHIINSQIKNLKRKSNQTYIVRSGIYTCTYNLIFGKIKEENLLINEGFNQLQTLDILSNLLELEDTFINDEKLKYYLSKVKEEQKISVAYKDEVDLLKPLYENKRFKNMYKINSLEGNLDTIKYHFNLYTEGILFNVLADCVTNIDNKERVEEGKKLIKTYLQNQ